MSDQLPDRFALTVRDEAMAPRFRPGHLVEFDRTRQAEPGDVVLLADGDGNAYIREHMTGASDAEDFDILAVAVGHTWG